MADEITITHRFGVDNGNYDPGTISVNNLQFDQAAQGVQEKIVTINTSADVVISSSDLTTEGWLWMRNLDTTNYVQWGTTDGYIGRMEAEEPVNFRAEPSVSLVAKANTAACKVWYRWLED
jgi:hypothetical protein